MVQQWMRWDVLESLASYHSIVKLLFGIVQDAMDSTRLRVRPVTWLLLLDSSRIRIRLNGPTMPSRRRYFNVCPKIFAILRIDWSRSFEIPKATKVSWPVVATLPNYFLICFRMYVHPTVSCCFGPNVVYQLLDSLPESSARPRLSKALERLSRASGLHPTCFPLLTGLVKVGHQIAAGGFGDIWKGLLGGQKVSVKIMRLFRDADIKDALQVKRVPTLLSGYTYRAITGIWSRSSHLASAFSPEFTSLLWVVLFRQQTLPCVAVDVEWTYYRVSEKRTAGY
jgi:hypothetical protein